MSITFRFQPQSGSEMTVTVPGQVYGSDEAMGRRQIVGKSLGEQVYVYEIADGEHRELNIQLEDLQVQDRASLERFFERQNVRGAFRWFKVDVPNSKRVILRAGAQVDGATIKAGTTYKAGEYIKPDLIRHTVRLLTPEIQYAESLDGVYTATMKLKILDGFLPENFV